MKFKEEKGLTAVDVAISIVILTIFLTMIANLIVNINSNSEDVKRKTTATSYAVQEIESLKAQGYVENYNGKGIKEEEILEDADIYDSTKTFTGFHRKVTLKDYVLVVNDPSKEQDIVKQITVEISYKLKGKDKQISLSTYVAKEQNDEKNKTNETNETTETVNTNEIQN